jgi:hypothetical protein
MIDGPSLFYFLHLVRDPKATSARTSKHREISLKAAETTGTLEPNLV